MRQHLPQVFSLEADTKQFRWLGVKASGMRPLALLIQGEPLRDRWQPPVVEELLEDGLPDGPLGDFPYLDGVPTLSKRAVADLHDLLADNGELLPLRGDARDFQIFNVTRFADVLNEDRSNIRRFESSGRVMDITAFDFDPDKIAGLSIFKIPQVPRPLVLVTDAFVKRVDTAGLRGFVFRLLWPTGS